MTESVSEQHFRSRAGHHMSYERPEVQYIKQNDIWAFHESAECGIGNTSRRLRDVRPFRRIYVVHADDMA
jgi:hypothetical protein